MADGMLMARAQKHLVQAEECMVASNKALWVDWRAAHAAQANAHATIALAYVELAKLDG